MWWMKKHFWSQRSAIIIPNDSYYYYGKRNVYSWKVSQVCSSLGEVDDFGRPHFRPLAGSAPLGVVASADGSILDLTSDDVKLVPLKRWKGTESVVMYNFFLRLSLVQLWSAEDIRAEMDHVLFGIGPAVFFLSFFLAIEEKETILKGKKILSCVWYFKTCTDGVVC